MDTIGNFLSSNSGAIGSALGAGAQAYGQQNAAEAIEQANNGAITNQNATLGNVNNLYGAQTSLGNNSMNSLNNMLNGSANGGTPNYSAFMNMPGYNFAVQQGTQTAERQAAAMGNAGNSGTAAMIGNQITGTAMQDYNTYIGQLQNAANLGGQANQGLGNITYNTGANTSQLMANTGTAQAGMYTGMGQTAGGVLGGVNGSGVAGTLGSSIVGGIGNILGGTNSSSSTAGQAADPNDPYAYVSGSQWDSAGNPYYSTDNVASSFDTSGYDGGLS